jgi:signal peptidase I
METQAFPLDPWEIKMNKKHIFKEIAKFCAQVAVMFAVVFVLTRCVIIHAQVISPSMEDTLPTWSWVVGSRLSYVIGEPHRFDIILFENPINPSDHPFVKRIIGLPYETVEIRDGLVFIDGSDIPLDDAFTKEPSFGNHGPFLVPVDSFFVLGDHRNNSADSRNLANPFIHRDVIIGRLHATLLPRPAIFRRPS